MTSPPQLDSTGLVSALGYNDAFLPDGVFAREAGNRAGAVNTRDFYGWSLGLDHNQRIPVLNARNSFAISAQLFWMCGLGVKNDFNASAAPGLLNDMDALALRPRSSAPTGPNESTAKQNRPGGAGQRTSPCILPSGAVTPPCSFKGLLGAPAEQQTATLAISTPYLQGRLVPRVLLLYDFAGSWLIQPGIDWTFWDPFRLQLRYNYLDGNYAGIGFFKTRDSVWLELQYLFY